MSRLLQCGLTYGRHKSVDKDRVRKTMCVYERARRALREEDETDGVGGGGEAGGKSWKAEQRTKRDRATETIPWNSLRSGPKFWKYFASASGFGARVSIFPRNLS